MTQLSGACQHEPSKLKTGINLRILFVYSLNDINSPEKPLRSPAQMQFGISYLSSLLKKHGHQTRLVVLGKILGRRNETTIETVIKEFTPHVICFTAVATEYLFISLIAGYVKKRFPHIYLVIGGPHVSLNPEESIRDSFNALCVGEGEYPALELITKLERSKSLSGISNMWFMNDSKIERNKTRPFLTELDSLPFPDREMWKEWTEEPREALYPVLLGRGCPYRCTYCSNHALRKLASGTYVRFRSPESIAEEIKDIAGTYPNAREVYLEVETIGTNINWAFELCEKLQDIRKTLGRPLTFGTNLRITENSDFSGLFELFRESGFRFMNIGIESGSENIRRGILRRIYSNDTIIKTVEQARLSGLQICFYNLIGLPGESREDFMQTVKINRECQPDWHFTSIFYPYPGTDLYEICKKQGLLSRDIGADVERSKAILDMHNFSRKEIQKCYAWFDYYVYRGYRPMYLILIKVLISRLRTYPGMNYLFERLFILEPLHKLKQLMKKRYRG